MSICPKVCMRFDRLFRRAFLSGIAKDLMACVPSFLLVA